MDSIMGNKQVANTYKQTDREYIEGIETPHGRIKILYQTIISNIDKMPEQPGFVKIVQFLILIL